MAQDELDLSPEMDLITLFSSSNVDAEMEASTIHNLLQANGIPSVVMGPSTIPSLAFEVQVPRESAEEAQRLIDEARIGGPASADEAEAAGEEPGGAA
jgi:hypothetical protein